MQLIFCASSVSLSMIRASSRNRVFHHRCFRRKFSHLSGSPLSSRLCTMYGLGARFTKCSTKVSSLDPGFRNIDPHVIPGISVHADILYSQRSLGTGLFASSEWCVTTWSSNLQTICDWSWMKHYYPRPIFIPPFSCCSAFPIRLWNRRTLGSGNVQTSHPSLMQYNALATSRLWCSA